MSIGTIRNLRNQWFPPKPSFTEKDVPSQQGKVFIVTGGNTGVGYALIKLLYGTGATIYMASRNKAKADKAIKDLLETTPAPKNPSKLKFLQLDLNDLLSVKAAATTFAQQESRLDVLWNNAGAGANAVDPNARTVQDLDLMIGANIVATLLFSTLLVPQLKAASVSTVGQPARVVWTSSYMAEGMSPPNGVDLALLDSGAKGPVPNYAMSKAGTWYIGREFAKRYGQDNIISVSQNPGNLRSGGYDNVSALTMFFISPLLHETKFGGYTELYAGLSPDITLKNNGAYVVPWGRLRPDSGCPRKDILTAMKSEEEGGLGYPKKLWEYAESKWKPYI
ncbi:hypothetical protein VTL71DRAFT_14601 [Oculimacula yallundae]|uniref:Uncharacterized protein n=1 Tax=Oculimacula yallundae TaxID=86028 RepID=A0ABR4CIX9_9HELO